MWKSGLRFVILAAMNILKSKTCELMGFLRADQQSHWIKFCILTSLLFLFAFVSVETLPLASPNNVGFLRVRIKSFVSPSLLACFLACLFLPQFLFWYLCPLILAWFWCFDCISKTFLSFASCVGNALSVVPDLNVAVEAANAGDEGAANVDEEGTPEV